MGTEEMGVEETFLFVCFSRFRELLYVLTCGIEGTNYRSSKGSWARSKLRVTQEHGLLIKVI